LSCTKQKEENEDRYNTILEVSDEECDLLSHGLISGDVEVLFFRYLAVLWRGDSFKQNSINAAF